MILLSCVFYLSDVKDNIRLWRVDARKPPHQRPLPQTVCTVVAADEGEHCWGRGCAARWGRGSPRPGVGSSPLPPPHTHPSHPHKSHLQSPEGAGGATSGAGEGGRGSLAVLLQV